MSSYFLDSSALVKRYIVEPGTSWIQNTTMSGSGHSIIVARITQAEIVSAVSRQKREGAITTRSARAIRLVLDRHVRTEYNVVELAVNIVQRAENLLETYPLRAYDAVQLASAIESNIRLTAANIPALIFVSADQRLLTAAQQENLATDNPLTHS